jgi:hypothetical protein
MSIRSLSSLARRRGLIARAGLCAAVAVATMAAVVAPAQASDWNPGTRQASRLGATVNPLAATATVTPKVTAAAATTYRVPVGSQFHGLWSNYTDTQRTQVLDRLKAAGVTSIRVDLSWVMLQPNGPTSYDAWGVSFVDKIVKMANDRGMKPLMTLWLTPTWANGDTGYRTAPTNPADYARVAQWAATRYKGKVVGWEVWNEPNSPSFLTGADPAVYARLLKAAYPAIKAADPTVPVLFAGVEYNDDAWIKKVYDNGVQGSFDVLATHPYMGIADADPTTPDDGTMWTMTHVAAIHNLMAARGDGAKPIWFTEFGWSTHGNAANEANWNRGVSEATQSTYLVRAANMISANYPYVQRMYWYADRDSTTGTIQYNNYGLFRLDYSAKPAVAGLATANGVAG